MCLYFCKKLKFNKMRKRYLVYIMFPHLLGKLNYPKKDHKQELKNIFMYCRLNKTQSLIIFLVDVANQTLINPISGFTYDIYVMQM